MESLTSPLNREHWQVCTSKHFRFNSIECMQLYSAFMFAKFSPLKHRQTTFFVHKKRRCAFRRTLLFSLYCYELSFVLVVSSVIFRSKFCYEFIMTINFGFTETYINVCRFCKVGTTSSIAK